MYPKKEYRVINIAVQDDGKPYIRIRALHSGGESNFIAGDRIEDSGLQVKGFEDGVCYLNRLNGISFAVGLDDVVDPDHPACFGR